MTLNDFFPEWKTGKGIFNFLHTGNVPWKDAISSSVLDLDYHANHSGHKTPAPVVLYTMLETKTDVERQTLANVVLARFLTKWTKLWDTFSFEYNPIENYSMLETRNTTYSGVEQNETWADGHGSTETENGTYGFNSSESVPHDDGSGSSDSNAHSKDIRTFDNRKDSESVSRSGNIGVTTSQQMIQSERDLWMYDFFNETVYADIDRVLTLVIY